MRKSTIVYLVKMEYGIEYSFGLKMVMKSGLCMKKIFEIPVCALWNVIIHFQYYIIRFLHKITNSVTKMTFYVHEEIFKKCTYDV